MRDQVIFSAEGRINSKKERARDCKNSSVAVNVPVSYKSNTAREDLCLEYVQSFLRQYEKLYPTRKLPYIMVDNEQGLQKFICSFIRPTQIAISELYDMYECSAFLAGYILYEPLDPVTKPPQIIFSPTETLKRHTGDCFDISTLLCSLLIGCGYDAYVVCGYAPRHITLRDQSSTLFPMSNNQNDTIVKTKLKSEEEEDSPDIPIDDSVKTSEFVAHQEERKRLEMLDKFELWITDLPPPPTPSQQEIIDNSVCGERRLHAWVMILAGQRDLKENYFFESSTGRAYSTSGSPYTEIDSVWNANNFWVLNKPDTKIADINFDLSRSDTWESLFPFGAKEGCEEAKSDVTSTDRNDESSSSSSSDNNSSSSSSSSSGNDSSSGSSSSSSSSSTAVPCLPPISRIFENPPSWVAPIALERSKYLLRYPPLGRRTVQYFCTNVDFYASNSHPQCMVMRITAYLNKERTVVKEITEWFENRKDKMFKRVRVMLGGESRFMEFYHPGGAGEIKQWTQYPGKKIEVDFHVSGRLDRLVRRVETVGEKVAEHFIGRTDNLIYRSVLFTSDSSMVGSRQFLLAGDGLTPQLYIVKMTQRFAVDESLTSTEQHSLAERVFYVSEGKAVATYHFKNDMITRLVRTYMYSKGVGVPSMSKQAYLQEQGVVEDPILLQEVALLERESYSAVKLVYQQMLSINTMRAESEKNVINEKNVFEIALNNADTLDASQGVISEGGAERDPKGLNYLTPYLRKYKNKVLSELTREEAIEIRQNCLDALRSRLVERANIIQCRLNDENSKLGREQDLYQRRERDDDLPTEEYQKYCADAVFRIQILEQRLAAHEEAALKKFAELDVRLAADERLRVLWPTTAKT